MSEQIRFVKNIVLKNPNSLTMYENNARINDHVVPALMNSIKRFGFNQPVVIDGKDVIVCGHTRVKAAIRLGMMMVPCVYTEGLTQKEIDAYRLADNKIAEQALWDYEKLEKELEMIGVSINMEEFGFVETTAPNVNEFFEQKAGGKESGNPTETSEEDPENEPRKPFCVKCPHCGEMFEV